MNHAETKLTAIGGAILAGGTVRLATATRVTPITPTTARKWADAGLPLFRARPNGLFMRERGAWVCVDYCRITVEAYNANCD